MQRHPICSSRTLLLLVAALGLAVVLIVQTAYFNHDPNRQIPPQEPAEKRETQPQADLSSEIDLVKAAINTLNHKVSAITLRMQHDSAKALPASAEPADLRPLPFPFYNYFTITSDVDGMSWGTASNIHRLVNKQLYLNLSDSTFVDNWYDQKRYRTSDKGTPEPVIINTVDKKHFYEFVQWYNNGWFDTIHGWGETIFYFDPENRNTIITANPSTDAKSRTVSLKRLSGKIVETNGQVPRSLIFEYAMVGGGDFTVDIVNDTGTPLWRAVPKKFGEPALGGLPGTLFNFSPRADFTVQEIPLEDIPSGIFNGDLVRITVNFLPWSKAPENILTIRNVALVNGTPSRILNVSRMLTKYNLFLPIFTHHEAPYYGVFGAESRLQMTSESTYWPWIAELMGDRPGSPFYWIDLLDIYGVDFILPAHRTGEIYPGGGYTPLDITKLVYPFEFLDKKRRYAFNRAIFVPNAPMSFPSLGAAKKVGNKGDPISWSNALALQIDTLTATFAAQGSGAALYTHWGCCEEEFVDGPTKVFFSEEIIGALTRLAERHYGWSGKKRIPFGRRLWIPSTIQLLNYSRMIQRAKGNVFFDPVTNVVHVSRWIDPVTQTVFPAYRAPLKQLQGLTVYVRTSESARVFLDGVEVNSFKRNGPDLTGRESITFVDDSTPKTVFDEVDLYQQNGNIISENAFYFFHKRRGYSGRRMFEIRLDGSEGAIHWAPAALDSSGATHFRFSYRPEVPGTAVGVCITMQDGSQYFIGDDEVWNKQHLTWRLSRWHHDTWRDVILDFVDADRSKASKFALPRGPVKEVTFVVKGKKGSGVFFDQIEFLRENAVPDPPDGYLIAGQISATKGTPAKTPISLSIDGVEHRVATDDNGIFFFGKKVPRNAIVQVYAVGPNNDRYFPTIGRYFQVKTNVVDLAISLDDPRPDIQGEKPARLVNAQTAIIDGVGIHFKPHSIYETTGLPNLSEYYVRQVVNNLGYLDRERRFDDEEAARRIILYGTCLTFGHTEHVHYHPTTVLEGILEHQTGQDFEVINMASTNQVGATHWFFHNQIGRKFLPEIAIFEISSLVEIGMGDPQVFAGSYLYHPDHLPTPVLRLTEQGALEVQKADPNHLAFMNKDSKAIEQRQRESEISPYLVGALDMRFAFHQDDSFPLNEAGQRVYDYLVALMKKYKSDLAKDGTKVLFVINDTFATQNSWTEKGMLYSHKFYTDRFKRACGEAGVPCFFFREFVEQNHGDTLLKHWRRDNHFSRIGYRWYAEGVADYLKRTNFLDNFVTVSQ